MGNDSKRIRWVAGIFAGGILLGMLSGMLLGVGIWMFFYRGNGKPAGEAAVAQPKGGGAGEETGKQAEEKRVSRVRIDPATESVVRAQARQSEPETGRKPMEATEWPKEGGGGGGSAGSPRLAAQTASGPGTQEWGAVEKMMGSLKTRIMAVRGQPVNLSVDQRRMLEEIKRTGTSERIKLAAKVMLREFVTDKELKASDAQAGESAGEGAGSLLGLKALLDKRFSEAANAYEAHALGSASPIKKVDAGMALLLDWEGDGYRDRKRKAAVHASEVLKAAKTQGLMKEGVPVGPAMHWMAMAQAVEAMVKMYEGLDADAATVESALSGLERAQRIWRSLGEMDGVAWCYMQMGHVKRRPSKQGPGEGMALYKRAAEIWTQESSPVMWAKVQESMGEACRFSQGPTVESDRREGLACVERALGVFKKKDDPEEFAEAQVLKMQLILLIPEQRTAAGFYQASLAAEEAQSVFTKANEPGRWASIHEEMADGWAYCPFGSREENIKKAMRMCEEALSVRQYGTRIMLAKAYSRIGWLWMNLQSETDTSGEELTKAVDALGKAAAIAEKDPNPSPGDLGVIRARLGYAQMKLAEYPGQRKEALRREAREQMMEAQRLLSKDPRKSGDLKKVKEWMAMLD